MIPGETEAGENATKKLVTSQKSSRVSITEAVKQTTPTGSVKKGTTPAGSVRKGLSKAASATSLGKSGGDKSSNLEVKEIEARSPSPIPEDPREYDSGKASTSKQESVKKDETEEEKEKKKEEEEKKKEDETKKIKEGKSEKPSTSAAPPPQDDPALSTTKLRGKSKATGQIMGGWI